VAKLILCGRIGRPVGLKGECAVHWISGEPPVAEGGEILIDDPENGSHKTYKIAALRRQGRSHFLRIEGVLDRTAAASLTNRDIFIDEGKLPELDSGEYYCHQIFGMEVVTEDGRRLGTVVKIFTAGGHDVYEVLPDGAKSGSEILIPAIDSIVLNIDVKKKRMVVRPLKGMVEE